MLFLHFSTFLSARRNGKWRTTRLAPNIQLHRRGELRSPDKDCEAVVVVFVFSFARAPKTSNRHRRGELCSPAKDCEAAVKTTPLFYCGEAMLSAIPIRKTTPKPLPVAFGDLKKRHSVGGADVEIPFGF